VNDGDELLDKANALLSKYREGPDFPVLTEVVELHPRAPYVEPRSEISSSPSSVAPASDGNGTLAGELRALEENLERDILLRLQPCLQTFLGEPLELRIRTQFEAAMTPLITEVASAIRADISDLARQAVAEALEKELSALRDRINLP
jgi:hypothetical protein